MKEITIEQLHQETDHWVKEAADNGGIVITEHGKPVAALWHHGPVKREKWLQKRLAALEQMPFISVDSGEVISEDREDRT